MSPRNRLVLFLAGALGLCVLWVTALAGLFRPVELADRYLTAINDRTFSQRNITDAVTAVNFDYRGFDTLGEEFILFASVMGALVLLKQASEKEERPLLDAVTQGRALENSDAMR